MRGFGNVPLIFVIIVLSMALGFSMFTRGHEWGDDWASYVMQAQSILDGKTDEFVERNAFTIFESSVQIGPVAYPWGYPLALTPALLLKGVHALTLKLPGLFFFAGFLVCLYLLIEPRLTPTESLLIVSLFAFNPTFVGFLDYILSDIPFLFSVFLALFLISGTGVERGAWRQILSGSAIFFAFFIRTTGVILLAGFLLHQALLFLREKNNRRTIALNSMIVIAAFTALWLISSLLLPNGQGSYFQQLMGLTLEKFLNNIRDYFYLFTQFFGATPAPAWKYVYYALVVLFLLGAWARREADRVLLLFFVLYFVVMLVWPEWQGIRFIFPLLPLFFYFALQGANALLVRLSERYKPTARGMIYLFGFALVGLFLFHSGTQAYTNLKDGRRINGPFDPFSYDLYNFIRAETPPDSVIVFFKPRALRLFTDRDSFMALECDRLPLGDYVALHKNWEYSQILPGDVQNCNLPLKNVYENRRFILYEVEKQN
ncbi:MAG: hypothetical protein L6Q26_01910 [Anaerolineales bacterium]|nr:hypothetical protein [Anaerolineales bacterium]NUQ83307.1 hypothetical protein [Anaerolineales bacterium]